jgi:hypothetical protein
MYIDDSQLGFDPANLPMPGDIYNFLTTAGERQAISNLPQTAASALTSTASTIGATASALVPWWLKIALVVGIGAGIYAFIGKR